MVWTDAYTDVYFMRSGRISRNIRENIFRSYTGSTSENTDFHVLIARIDCACLATRWKYDVIYRAFFALDVILYVVCGRDTPRGITEKNCTGF